MNFMIYQQIHKESVEKICAVQYNRRINPLWKGLLFMIQKTPMLKRQTLQFLFRLVIFFTVFALYLYDQELMYHLATQPIQLGINLLHIIWLIFMVMMNYRLYTSTR